MNDNDKDLKDLLEALEVAGAKGFTIKVESLQGTLKTIRYGPDEDSVCHYNGVANYSLCGVMTHSSFNKLLCEDGGFIAPMGQDHRVNCKSCLLLKFSRDV